MRGNCLNTLPPVRIGLPGCARINANGAVDISPLAISPLIARRGLGAVAQQALLRIGRNESTLERDPVERSRIPRKAEGICGLVVVAVIAIKALGDIE